ncbi:hypothetical protein [Streptomyces phaeochromogenes]|uniref:hypothetical protein n=1 Tax=Streptomyces phaeochromogenes TaxID=1923 RepID=UPI002DD8030C|nr:hypothetical protein [Streptomyces phaeochromogenes]WRZ30190.1 hypothetical protein OG931_21790 [Streptomyces phaeochromogenes]
MAALAKATITCPGCSEPIALSMRLDPDAKAGPGELVLAVDRSAVNRHLATVHAEAQDV